MTIIVVLSSICSLLDRYVPQNECLCLAFGHGIVIYKTWYYTVRIWQSFYTYSQCGSLSRNGTSDFDIK